jgi:hypothetical protein
MMGFGFFTRSIELVERVRLSRDRAARPIRAGGATVGNNRYGARLVSLRLYAVAVVT